MRDFSSNHHALLAKLCKNITRHVGMWTLHREIHEFSVNSCIAVKKLFLNNIHGTIKRLAFAKQHDRTVHDSFGTM